MKPLLMLAAAALFLLAGAASFRAGAAWVIHMGDPRAKPTRSELDLLARLSADLNRRGVAAQRFAFAWRLLLGLGIVAHLLTHA